MTARDVDDEMHETANDRTDGAAATSERAAHNPLVDAYIARAAPFARPILAHLRHVVHAACPEVIEEIKWQMPFFVHRGNLCHMAAFKAHCAFGFWRGKEMPELPVHGGGDAMGNLGRILSIDDLPPRRKLAGYVKAAMKLNDSVRKPARVSKPKTALAMPDDLARALNAHRAASQAFNAFSPSCQREYIEWIVAAKRAETRVARIAQAVAWIAEGKTRNWKYAKC